MEASDQQGQASGPQTGPQTPEKATTSKYVVQRAVGLIDGAATWEDVGSIEVPIRTQRKTVVERALEEFNVPADAHPSSWRVLDVDAAEEIPVRLEQPPAPPAVLKVG